MRVFTVNLQVREKITGAFSQYFHSNVQARGCFYLLPHYEIFSRLGYKSARMRAEQRARTVRCATRAAQSTLRGWKPNAVCSLSGYCARGLI